MTDIKKNFIYNVAYQLLILIIPLVTMPYISRVLGANGIGEYSYTYSIVYYFMMIAMLGFNNYGNRAIAKARDNKKELSKTFKEIHLLQIITTSIMCLLYLIYIIISKRSLFVITACQSLYLLSCMFDINWFFFGTEQFKLTVTRNTIVKALSLILVFLLVKKENDVWIYTIILSGTTLLSQLLLWPFIHKYTEPIKIKITDIKKHILPCIKLFLPVVAVSIYKIMDKTMIGIFSNVTEVGYYEAAEKIINVPISIITAFGTVMLPRMSNMVSKSKEPNKTIKIIEVSMSIIIFLSAAMMFGLITVAKNFSAIFYGEKFIQTGYLIIYLSITILFLGWGNVVRTQYLIPNEMDKEYIVSAFLGALVNLIINLLFIPRYGASGACIGTIFAEFIVVVYQTYSVKKYLPIQRLLRSNYPFFIKAIVMFSVIYWFNYIPIKPIYVIVLQILGGIIMYVVLNLRFISKVLLNVK